MSHRRCAIFRRCGPLRNRKTREEEAREANLNPKLPLPLHVDAPDPVVDRGAAGTPGPGAMPAPILNFDGIPFPGVGCNCAPPDTNGAVGLTQYVQMVNEGYQVFNKTTGASVLGPTAITAIWSGFGGVCQTNGEWRPGRPLRPYRQPLAHQPVRRRRRSRPTSASPSRLPRMPPALTIVMPFTSAPTFSIIRISASGPTATTWP